MTLEVPKELKKAQRLANLLDTSVRLPIIDLRLGLDFILGLVPIVGDLLVSLLALRIVYLAQRMGVDTKRRSTMLRNILIDLLIGSVPVVGDLFDLVFKANQKNVRLMEQWWLEQHQQDLKHEVQRQLEQLTI